jgi:hypothetical protein
MLTRRSFIRSLAAGGASLALTPFDVLADTEKTRPVRFSVHPFIEANPTAVFVMRTNVSAKTDAAAVKQAGLKFGTSVFVPVTTGGVPLSHRVVVKPNIVTMPNTNVESMGIVTDAHFVEGVIESLKMLGLREDRLYLREVKHPEQFANSGYAQMAARTGADLRKLDDPIGVIAESDLQWIDVPDGHWFSRIPYLWPVNAPDTWLLNIAKFKTHAMGMSLCAKNIQGTIAIPYVRHCVRFDGDMGIAPGHIQPGAKARILASYRRHVAAGVPRWDKPGEYGGIWQETWATRCMDNNSVTLAGLNVIEAVYGREGPFVAGPGPGGLGVDHLTNMIIFGKNPFHVDTIGLWLGGHEPGNFGYVHMAVERGLSTILNPAAIPLYEWKADGSAVPTPLESLQRFSLRTQYLRRDYGGQQEEEWHLVNEPYAYGRTQADASTTKLPSSFTIRHSRSFPSSPLTSIQIELPRAGPIRVEIVDMSGRIVDLLLDEYRRAGRHLIPWDARRRAPGVYFCRALFEGTSAVTGMTLPG